MLKVYALKLNTVVFIMFALIVLWVILGQLLPKKLWQWINIAFVGASFFLIFVFTVFGREALEQHVVLFMAEYTNEFLREMLMNVFLYFPLGLSLTVIIGKRAILVGFLLSLSIESWQYFAGTGIAQGTDVICNTIGCVIGTIGSIKWNRG